jgi:hypothetical protein
MVLPIDKISPKLKDLAGWEKIDEVNKMLDMGETPNSVCKWINKNGFKISPPLIYDYAKLRKYAVVNSMTMEKILGIEKSKQPKMKTGESFNQRKTKLTSELDVLDIIIDRGYNSIQTYWDNKPIPISILMQAIKLKNELTDNQHGFLTPYGIEQLTLMEKEKYQVLTNTLLQFVPEENREDALNAMEQAEEEYYKNCSSAQYYEEYLRACGLSEEEIQKKLREAEQEAEEKNTEESIEE